MDTPALAKVSYTHDAMIDMMLAQPSISGNELAARFGYTPSWISIIRASDAFKERLEARRAEVVDPALAVTVKERFEAVVTRSLEVLQEKLSVPPSAVPDNLALRAAELGAKALGLGGNAPPAAPSLPPNHLVVLAARLNAMQPQGVTYEHQEIPAAG